MRGNDYISLGGEGRAFPETQWLVIEAVQSGDRGRQRALIGVLIEQYWRPIYACLRRKGYRHEDAQDLTQDFFHEVVLQRHLFEKVNPARGRLRTLLWVALEHYLKNVRDAQTARRRIPRERLVRLEMVEPKELAATKDLSAEDCFDAAWMHLFIERALQDVEAHCRSNGKTVHWHVFCDRVLQPILCGAHPPSLEEVCDTYGIDEKSTASNMIVTVKRRLQKALRECLRYSVTHSELVDEELGELRRLFPWTVEE